MWAWAVAATPPKFVPAPHRAIVATASVHPSQTLTRAENERASDKERASVAIGHLPVWRADELNRAHKRTRLQSRRYSANGRSRVRAWANGRYGLMTPEAPPPGRCHRRRRDQATAPRSRS